MEVAVETAVMSTVEAALGGGLAGGGK